MSEGRSGDIAPADPIKFTDATGKLHAFTELSSADQRKMFLDMFCGLVKRMEPEDVAFALSHVEGKKYSSQAEPGAEVLVRSLVPFVKAESLLFFLATEDKRFKVVDGAVTLASK